MDDQLNRLAELMIDKPDGELSPQVVFFVGAGASSSAKLPMGNKFSHLLRKAFTQHDGKKNDQLEKLLKMDAKKYFPNRQLNKLTLFELSSILSRTELGKSVLRSTIKTTFTKPTHRPLAYELLSHFVKHGFVDHIINLNFDILLDEAISDELSEDFAIVASDSDIPRNVSKNSNFLVKPFGTYSKGDYKVSLKEVLNFGSPKIQSFILKNILSKKHSKDGKFILVFLGYLGAEQGLVKVLEDVSDYSEFFIINGDRGMVSDHIKNLEPNIIKLKADVAMEKLAIRLEELSKNRRGTIPYARHKIVSGCEYSKLSNKNDRFALEVILQGVKSRGFIHFESYSKIPRLQKYGDDNSKKVLDWLLKEGMLNHDSWQGSASDLNCTEYVPNFILEKNTSKVARWLKSNFQLNLGIREIEKYLVTIQEAPDIEVSRIASAPTQWFLGPNAEPLDSVSKLMDVTWEQLVKLNSNGGKLKGIWSTGEWLFAKSGWAYEIGAKLLENDKVWIEMIITSPSGTPAVRSEKRKEVLDLVSNRENVKVLGMNWWELNRVMTIFKNSDDSDTAIYFRRRLNQPVVQPYYLRLLASKVDPVRYLDDIWKVYEARSISDFGR